MSICVHYTTFSYKVKESTNLIQPFWDEVESGEMLNVTGVGSEMNVQSQLQEMPVGGGSLCWSLLLTWRMKHHWQRKQVRVQQERVSQRRHSWQEKAMAAASKTWRRCGGVQKACRTRASMNTSLWPSECWLHCACICFVAGSIVIIWRVLPPAMWQMVQCYTNGGMGTWHLLSVRKYACRFPTTAGVVLLVEFRFLMLKCIWIVCSHHSELSEWKEPFIFWTEIL